MENIFADRDYLLWVLLIQATNAMSKMRARELGIRNVSSKQAAILLIAEATEGNVSAYKIAKWTVTEPHTISAVLKRMETSGFIELIDKRKSRKGYKILITNKGKNILKYVKQFDAISRVIGILTDEDRNNLTRILRKLRDETLPQIGIRTKLPFSSY